MAKSIIKKGIIRKIRTADFEQLDVSLNIEEEIEWKNKEERENKTKKITELLINDFKEVYNEVCKEIEISRCIGTVKTNIMKKKSNNNIISPPKNNDDLDFDSL